MVGSLSRHRLDRNHNQGGATVTTKRIAVLLPGLGRIQRGAETAFLEIAGHLNRYADMQVQLFGSGDEVPADLPIHRIACRSRESFEGWPKLPALRSECHYEELSFVHRLWKTGALDPREFDVTLSCTYPFINWYLQRLARRSPLKNVFVTQNGDWMCRCSNREYRYFACDGLVCINPDYYAANQENYRSVLIPNGTDPDLFVPASDRALERCQTFERLSISPSDDHKLVVMASALISSKRVDDAIRSVALVADAHLVVAGDGPERTRLQELAHQLLPGRHTLLGSIPREAMPSLFRSADAFLHTSQDEPFGIVYLEAAATGLPIVTHDAETPRWILGDTALFAHSSQHEALANQLRTALLPQSRDTLGRAARERVMADWTWKAQAAKYRKFILSLLGEATDEQEEGHDEQPQTVDHHCQLQHV